MQATPHRALRRRPSVPHPVHEWQSVAISGNPWQSVAISGSQCMIGEIGAKLVRDWSSEVCWGLQGGVGARWGGVELRGACVRMDTVQTTWSHEDISSTSLRHAAKMRRERQGPISYAMRCDEEMCVVSLVAVCGVGDCARRRQSGPSSASQRSPWAPRGSAAAPLHRPV